MLLSTSCQNIAPCVAALSLTRWLISKKIISLSSEHKGHPAFLLYSNYSDLVLTVCEAACAVSPQILIENCNNRFATNEAFHKIIENLHYKKN